MKNREFQLFMSGQSKWGRATWPTGIPVGYKSGVWIGHSYNLKATIIPVAIPITFDPAPVPRDAT